MGSDVCYNVARPVNLLESAVERMFANKAKWPQEDKVFKMPKVGKVKNKLEEDKLLRTIASMHFMVAKSMRMCPML